jgi:hypothetical protein
VGTLNVRTNIFTKCDCRVAISGLKRYRTPDVGIILLPLSVMLT